MKSCWNKLLAVGVVLGVLSQVQAQADAGAGLIAVGGLAGTAVLAGQGGTISELVSWKDPQVDSTIRFGSSCGVLIETRLVGNNAYNYLFIALKNQTGAEVRWHYDQVRFNFDSGQSRLPTLHTNNSPAVVPNGITDSGFLAFPSKGDFEQAKKIQIIVPIQRANEKDFCHVQVEHFRNASVESESKDYTSATSFDFQLGGGGVFARTGNRKNLANHFNWGGEIGLNGYPGTHWGMSMALFFNSVGDVPPANAATISGASIIDPKLSSLVMLLGASYRNWLGEKWTWAYDLGPAIDALMFDEAGQSSRQDSTHFGLGQRLRLNYRLYRTQQGPWRGDYGIGISFNHIWIPDGSDVKGVEFGGSNFGVTLQLTAGI